MQESSPIALVRRSVWLVDDDPWMRQILRLMLEGWSWEVEEIGDGLEATARLASAPSPVVVLLDWEMPGLDGLAVCERLRTGPAGPYIYVVFLTARGQPGDRQRALDAGADAFLTKPVDPVDLRARLDAAWRTALPLAAVLAEGLTAPRDAGLLASEATALLQENCTAALQGRERPLP